MRNRIKGNSNYCFLPLFAFLLAGNAWALPFDGWEFNLGRAEAGGQGSLLQMGAGLNWKTGRSGYLSLKGNWRKELPPLVFGNLNHPLSKQLDLDLLYGLGRTSRMFYYRAWTGISGVYGVKKGDFLFQKEEFLAGDNYYQKITYAGMGFCLEAEGGFAVKGGGLGLFAQFNFNQDLPLWAWGIRFRFPP